MAASACEEYAARRINDNEQSPSAETRWNIFSAVDEIEAYTTLAAAPLPGLYVMPSGKSCTLRNIQIEDVAEYEADMPHRLTHKAVVTYSWQYEDTLDYEFEVSGQSVTITHSLDTVSYTGGGRTAPDFEGGININADGKIQGIDIDRPAFSFSVTKHWDFEYITQAYQVTLSKIVSTVNDAEYYGIPRGCVKLTGAWAQAGEEVPNHISI